MDAYLGEIRMFAGNYAPEDWALCNGQLLNINDYQPLYALIGTTYGGDGFSNFALPNMQGRVPVGQGQGSGLSLRKIAQAFGSETAALTPSQMPGHTHLQQASLDAATAINPAGNVIASTAKNFYENNTTIFTSLNSQSISTEGRNQSHTNTAPYLCINFIICLVGTFPSRNQ